MHWLQGGRASGCAQTGEVFSLVPPNSTAHNVIMGSTWVDCHGNFTLTNVTTGANARSTSRPAAGSAPAAMRCGRRLALNYLCMVLRGSAPGTAKIRVCLLPEDPGQASQFSNEIGQTICRCIRRHCRHVSPLMLSARR